MESIIQNLSWQNLINIFSSAKERIVIIMPAVHEEWVEVISRFHSAGSIELWICFDNPESAFRSGYGDIKSIYRLESMNATIKQCKDLYKRLFEFAELHFSGGNLSAKTITIPTNALPFKSAELKERITTRLNLFTKEITKDWNELSEIKKHLDFIRKEYLVPCSLRKDKCVLKKPRKEAFQKKLPRLRSWQPTI